jgi:hypothetical protein
MGKQHTPFKIKGPMSHSKATSCPMAIKLKQKKVKPEPREREGVDRRDLGKARHEVAKLLIKGYLARREWAPIHKVVAHITKRFPATAEMVGETELKMQAFTENFQFTPENVLGYEWELAVDGDGNECNYKKCPEDGWRGILDYAEAEGDTAHITDFKNQMNIMPKSELGVHSQVAGVYPFLINQAFPQITKFKVGIFYLEYEFHQIVDLTLEEAMENFRLVQSRGLRLLDLKDEEIFPEPGPGRCNYCDWLEACPVGKESVDANGSFKITSARQALETAKIVEVNEQRVKAQKDALKVWVKEHGNIELDTGIFRGFRETTKRDWNKDKLVELATKHDKDIGDLVNVDKAATERWLKSIKTPVTEVCSFYPGTEFTSFKEKPAEKKKKEAAKDEKAAVEPPEVVAEMCNHVRNPYGWKCSLEKGHRGNHIQYGHTTVGERYKKNEWTNTGN